MLQNVNIRYFLSQKCRLRALSQKMKNLHSKQSEQFIPPCLAISHSFALSVVRNVCTFVDALTCKKATSMYEDHHRSARIEVQCVNVYHLANENQMVLQNELFATLTGR